MQSRSNSVSSVPKSPMLDPQCARRRQADFVKLASSGNYVVTATETVGDFYVLFQGPSETPYEGGWWNIHVMLTEQYPYRSPSIGFANRVFHPNVDEASGSVCLDVITQAWTPMYDLGNVFDHFLPQLLRYPNPSDPLNPEAAALLLQNKASYTMRVQQHTARYATMECARGAVRQFLHEAEMTTTPIPVRTPQQQTSPAATYTSRCLTDSPPSTIALGSPADTDHQSLLQTGSGALRPMDILKGRDDDDSPVPEIEI